MIYNFKDSVPRWVSFENPNAEKGAGGMENNGAKGHPCDNFAVGEEKVLCDLCGSGVIRRIWITMNLRAPEILRNVYIKMFWDNSEEPQVNVPLADFFLMGLGEMRPFETRYFSTAEGRSLCCTIPMPFKKNAKVTLYNGTDTEITHLYYDIDLTLESLDENVMYFGSKFQDIPQNELGADITVFEHVGGAGRFLGTNIALIPDTEKYGKSWWGESEVKIYIDGDSKYPTLV